MNLVELEKIEDALRSDNITFAEAGEMIYASTTKPWQTKDWKKKRNELIKNSCEQCGSTKPPMVLQHMWHPSSYRNHIKIAYESILEDEQQNISLPDVKDEEVQIYLDQFTDNKESCPSCGVRSIRERKTVKPTYRCAKCYHEFDEPKMVPYHPKLGVAPSFNDLKRVMVNRRSKDYIWDTYGNEIRKKAILQGIEEHKRYISLEDTKTFCKRCAFLWDRIGKKVCDVCKDTLIPTMMHACYKCQKEGHPGIF